MDHIECEEETICEQCMAKDAADLMAQWILGEPINWVSHEDAWNRAIEKLKERSDLDK